MTRPSPAASETAAGLVLTALLDGEPKLWIIDGESRRLGGSRQADIVLSAPGISRLHARIFDDGDGPMIEDLGSKNGTRLDGRRIEGPEPLRVGLTVRLGTLDLRVEARPTDDLALGLELDIAEELADTLDGDPAGPLTRHRTLTGAAGAGGGLPSWIVDLVEALLQAPSREPGPALDILLSRVDADAAVVLEHVPGRPADDPWIVHARSGPGFDLPELPVTSPEPRSGEADKVFWRWAPFAPDPADPVTSTRVGGLVLLLSGAAPQGHTLDLACRVTLQWIVRGLERDAAIKGNTADSPPLQWPDGHVVSRAPAMQELYGQIRSIAGSAVPILILGETGVGKEHVAELVHGASGRSGPLVSVNCAAIPAELLEAELFGITKGVATGVRARTGRFQEAQNGTLFLDEIGDLPLSLQAKLLRVLQEQVVRPLGGEAVALDVRVVSATHADLRRQMEEGKLRQDLFFRLAGFELLVPPLRERREDLSHLVRHFAKRTCREAGKTVRGVSLRAMERLEQHTWPGNIRQLEHEIRRAVLLCPAGQIVDSTVLSPSVSGSGPAPAETAATDDMPDFSLGLDQALRELERHWIVKALQATAGNQTRAAKKLGISRNGLLHRMKKLALDPEQFRPS